MIKFLLLLVLALNFSCSSVKNSRVEVKPDGDHISIEVPEESVDDLDVVGVEDVSEDKELFKISKFVNFSQDEINKFYEVARRHDSVMKTKCVSDFMKKRGMTKTNGKSPEEVISHLLSEKPVIELEMYYSWKGVVGYTYPNSKRIWMNRRLHNNMSVCSRAGNMGHERSHKLDYGHSFKYHNKRYLSVPYTINDAFKACCI